MDLWILFTDTFLNRQLERVIGKSTALCYNKPSLIIFPRKKKYIYRGIFFFFRIATSYATGATEPHQRMQTQI